MGRWKTAGRRHSFGPPAAALFLLVVVLRPAFGQQADPGPATLPAPGVTSPADSADSAVAAASGVGRNLSLADRDLSLADLYLFDVHAGDLLLAQTLPAYREGDDFFLEMGMFADALEFSIRHLNLVWTGWFIDEAKTFDWQVSDGLVTIAGGEPEAVDPMLWFERDGETYVATALLESWFGVRLDIDVRQQILRVSSDQPLPFELWRERTLAKFRVRTAERFEPDVIVPDQYNWATQPLVNVDSQVMTRNSAAGRTTSQSLSLVAGMDLLKHSVVFSGSLARGGDDRSGFDGSRRRLTIERFSETPSKPIFGDIHHYAFGDIFDTNPSLVTAPSTGRGFVFDRYSDLRAGNLSSTTIADNAPPGWEVELYRDGVLIDFDTVGSDGRYFFPDQDIHFGENQFVAKLYGPQGQTREVSYTYFGGGIDLAPGDYDYSVSHIDYSEQLLDGHPENYLALPASYATDLRVSRALSSDLELGTALTRTGLGTRRRDGSFSDQQYLSVFGRARLGPGVLVSELVDQLDAGTAVSVEYLMGLGGRTFSFSHRAFDDYESPATLITEALDSYSEMSVLGFFGHSGGNGYRAGIRRRDLKGGGSAYRLFGRVGARVGPLSLTNELEHRIDVGQHSTLGLLRLAGRVRGMTIRGQVDYEISGPSLLRQVSASMNWGSSGRLNDSLTVSRSFTGAEGTYLTNLVSLRIRDYDVSFGFSSNFDDDWGLSAGVNFAFGYDARRREFRTDFQGLAETGRATMNLFVDQNNNGVRDPGEPPVEGVSFRQRVTDGGSPGELTLTALPSESPVQIDTGDLKFSDPFLAPRLKAYELTTHAGSDIEVDVPVVMTGDIEGTLLDINGAPARGITVVLVDRDGNRVAMTRSEFDGYFAFNGVPGGDYKIGVMPRRSETQVVGNVTLVADEGYASAGEIRLTRYITAR